MALMPRRAVHFAVLLVLVAGRLLGQTAQLALDVAPFPGLRLETPCRDIAETDDGLWFGYADRLLLHDGARLSDVDWGRPAGPKAATLRRLLAHGHRLILLADDGLRLLTTTAPPQLLLADATLDHGCLVIGGDGRLWARHAGGYVAIDVDGRRKEVQGAADLPIGLGLLPTADGAVTWNQQGLTWLADDGGHLVARRHLPMPGVRLVAVAGDRLVVVTQSQLGVVHQGGRFEVLADNSLGGEAQCLRVHGDDLWLVAREQLWHLSLAAPQLLPVALFGITAPVSSVAIDRQGLLWVSTPRGVARTLLCRGIDSFVLPALAENEEVTAIHETRGQIWLGTNTGRVLRETDGCWQEAEVPWRDEANTKPVAWYVIAMTSGADGSLTVATRQMGVWRWCDGWRRLDGPWRLVRNLTTTPDGDLWISADRSVHHQPANAPFAAPSLEVEQLPEPGRAAQVLGDADGNRWLTAYRGGIWSRPHGETAFRLLSDEWQRDSVLHAALADDGRSLWILSSTGLWQVDRRSGERTRLVENARVSPLRLLARQQADCLWLVRGSQLLTFDPGTQLLRCLPPGCGSHPSGFSLRSTFVRANGEVWLGASRGYTRILPGAHHDLQREARLGPVDVRAAGQEVAHGLPGQLRATVRGDLGPVQVAPRFVDRSLDNALSATIVLTDDQVRLQADAEGRFASLPPGDYHVDAMVTEANGLTTNHHLGRLRVLPPPPAWSLLHLALGALLLLGSTSWLLVHRRRAVRGVVHDLATLRPDAAVPVQEAARQAVGAGEACWNRCHPRHVSVWLCDGDGPILLARFGRDLRAARQRLDAARNAGVPVQKQWWLHHHGRRHDVLWLGTDDAGVEFAVLVADLAQVDRQHLQQFEQALAPLADTLHGRRWIQRLESNLAHRSSVIAAETHDLRSPLTVLRITAFELAEAAPTNTPELRTLAETVVTCVDRILGSFDRLTRQSAVIADLTLLRLDVAAVAGHVVERMRQLATNKQIRIDFVPPSAPLLATIDETWFERVFENLLGNAIKYSAAQTRVRIHFAATDEAHWLHLDDEGPGFSDADRCTAFLPGVTGSARTTGGESKSGIGLWIARQAMLAMGGDLCIGDRREVGARVSIQLPRDAAPGSAR